MGDNKNEAAKYFLGADIDLEQEVILDENGERLTNIRAQKIATEVLQRIEKAAVDNGV